MVSYISGKLSRLGPQLQFDVADINIDDDDLHMRQENRQLLGDYTLEQLRTVITEFGLLDELKKSGFVSPNIKIDTVDNFVHRIIVTDSRISKKGPSHNFLVDMYVRRKETPISELKCFHDAPEECQDVMKKFFGTNSLVITIAEWLRMQNPLVEFTNSRPQLPGQTHPGLGIGKRTVKMMTEMCVRKKRDGLFNYPEHFYNALLYRNKGFRFVNPAFEGFMRGLVQYLEPEIQKKSFSQVAWALHPGCRALVDIESGQPVVWDGRAEEQGYPTSSWMRHYFKSRSYQNMVLKYTKPGRFLIKWDEAHLYIPRGVLETQHQHEQYTRPSRTTSAPISMDTSSCTNVVNIAHSSTNTVTNTHKEMDTLPRPSLPPIIGSIEFSVSTPASSLIPDSSIHKSYLHASHLDSVYERPSPRSLRDFSCTTLPERTTLPEQEQEPPDSNESSSDTVLMFPIDQKYT